jgi:osmotically-inducible protein OsmY
MQTDLSLHHNILAVFDSDPILHKTEIGIAVCNGVVTLSGTCRNYVEKWTALRSIRKMPDIHAYVDHIVVSLPTHHEVLDTDIAEEIVKLWREDVGVPDDRLMVEVSNGCVTMTGIVGIEFQKEHAESLVHGIEGVREVINLIEVVAPEHA